MLAGHFQFQTDWPMTNKSRGQIMEDLGGCREEPGKEREGNKRRLLMGRTQDGRGRVGEGTRKEAKLG